MNYPERIVEVYLGLNGFFAINNYSTMTQKHDGINILALRMKGNVETSAQKDVKGCPSFLDDSFFQGIGIDPKTNPIGLIVRVNPEKGARREPHFEDARPFFGDYEGLKIVNISFEKVERLEAMKDGKVPIYIFPLSKCVDFIVKWIVMIPKEFLMKYKFSKSEPWNWSDDFLSDLISLWTQGLDLYKLVELKNEEIKKK